MKKNILFMSSLFASLLLFSCSETKDDNPVLNLNPNPDQSLYQNFLNVPEMSTQLVELTQANANGYLHLTCSQPDYGYAAKASYAVQISLSSDFTTPVFAGAPAAITLKNQFTDCSQINPNNDDVATALCKIMGLNADSSYPVVTSGPMYVRLISNIYNEEGTLIAGTTYTSNTVTFKQVSVGYLAASIPDLPVNVYLRGGMNNWGNDWDFSKEDVTEWQFYSTDEKGVYILKNDDGNNFTITKGTEFKVADSAWGTVNLGSSGSAFKIGTPYQLAGGGGNLVVPDDFYGTVTLEVNGTLPEKGKGDIEEGLKYTLTLKQDKD